MCRRIDNRGGGAAGLRSRPNHRTRTGYHEVIWSASQVPGLCRFLVNSRTNPTRDPNPVERAGDKRSALGG